MTTKYAVREDATPGFIQTLKTFPSTVIALLFFTLVIRFSYFMAWPFMTVIMTRNYHLSSVSVGIAMTSSALLAVGLGMYGGQLSDKLGRRGILSLGCALSFVGYALLGLAGGMTLFIIGLMIVGVCFAWVEPPIRALMSDLLGDRRRRALALQIRYYLVNVAAVTGPLVGIAFGLTSQKSTFVITAVSYLPLLVYTLLYIPAGKLINDKTQATPTIRLRDIMLIIARDKLFVAALMCSILCAVVFVHYESVVPLYLLTLDAEAAVKLITLILVSNACTVLIAQLFLVRFLARVSLPNRILLGGAIFALSQLLFWSVRAPDALLWVGVTIVFSIGEAILMPNLNILLDQLAPDEHRGAYLGASTLSTLGIALGPLIGGVMLTLTGAGVFLSTALFSLLLCAIIYASKAGIRQRLQE
ncbi:MFS transporter [Cedecea davisae]|uniref:MFS transporter n=1 Tax=Cedecea davisae TaxID=158484 RepID=A0ABS6DCA0_9ENTR|nr:MFS transporter [Cedecea davisae]MBU4680831.1 MFS transporter [Cedecea davisae]MBU4687446.1 MFS transporter [Cedecea davisae]